MNKKTLKILLMHFILFACLSAFVIFIPCPLFKISGIPCPLCGMTRAIIAFFEGNFQLAFSLHPLFFVFPFAFLFFCHARIIKNKIGLAFIVVISILIISVFFITYFVRDKSIIFNYKQPFFR